MLRLCGMPPSHSPHQSFSDHIQSVPVPKPRRTLKPTVSVVLALLLLGCGALYFWGKHLNTEAAQGQAVHNSGDDSTQ